MNAITARERRARGTRWAALSMTVTVGALGAMTIANAASGGHAHPSKTKQCSSSSACVAETNNGSGPAIQGNNGGVGYGVLGTASGSNAGIGGFNTATAAGASGIYGQSTNGPGINGFSQSNWSVWAQGSGASIAIPLFVSSPSNDGQYLWFAETTNGPGYEYGDDEGNIGISGQIFTEGSCFNGCAKGERVGSFAARTSQPTLDDVGESAMRDGSAHVALARDFANAIDGKKPYVVLLTPEGDASLYVANRTAGGFDVHEVGGGHASVAFAYRIVAKPYGVRDERLPLRARAFRAVPQRKLGGL